jgi:hypothetical protein
VSRRFPRVPFASYPVLLAFAALAGCVPPGNAPPYDAGPAVTTAPTFKPSVGIMTSAFEDAFDRPDAGEGADASALGANWVTSKPSAWRIENGRLCGENAKNHGIWLNRTLPVNARIEFDAIATTDTGDIKAEVWGDGKTHATAASYTNATSYLVILGGWKNSMHVMARLNEHGSDRKELRVDPNSDDARQRAVVRGQLYRFVVERSDGKTVRWSVNGSEYLVWSDPAPLAGEQHDHFGFNNWEVKVCFDNVKVTLL